jgi:hypothetical protein
MIFFSMMFHGVSGWEVRRKKNDTLGFAFLSFWEGMVGGVFAFAFR